MHAYIKRLGFPDHPPGTKPQHQHPCLFFFAVDQSIFNIVQRIVTYYSTMKTQMREPTFWGPVGNPALVTSLFYDTVSHPTEKSWKLVVPNHDGSNVEARAQNKHKKAQPQSQGLLLTFTVLYSKNQHRQSRQMQDQVWISTYSTNSIRHRK